MINTALSSRVLPGIGSQRLIVSLPEWAWAWLDDYVEYTYHDGYSGLIKDFRHALRSGVILRDCLQLFAIDLRDGCLREHHNLANDNYILLRQSKFRPAARRYPKSFKFPTIYQVFKFIPHATDLKTVWIRRNFHKL